MCANNSSTPTMNIVGLIFLVVLIAALLYFVPKVIVTLSLPRHIWLAATVSVLCVLGAFLFAWYTRKKIIKSSLPIMLLWLVIAYYLAMAGFAGTSAAIYAWRPSSYKINSTSQLWFAFSEGVGAQHLDTFGIFADYYTWAWLNLIPIIEIPKTLKISASLDADTPLGGVPILANRIYFVILVLGAYKKWKATRDKSSEGAA